MLTFGHILIHYLIQHPLLDCQAKFPDVCAWEGGTVINIVTSHYFANTPAGRMKVVI